jgi:hypothetical protein
MSGAALDPRNCPFLLIDNCVTFHSFVAKGFRNGGVQNPIAKISNQEGVVDGVVYGLIEGSPSYPSCPHGTNR